MVVETRYGCMETKDFSVSVRLEDDRTAVPASLRVQRNRIVLIVDTQQYLFIPPGAEEQPKSIWMRIAAIVFGNWHTFVIPRSDISIRPQPDGTSVLRIVIQRLDGETFLILGLTPECVDFIRQSAEQNWPGTDV